LLPAQQVLQPALSLSLLWLQGWFVPFSQCLLSDLEH
jgi:hypothetical protein